MAAGLVHTPGCRQDDGVVDAAPAVAEPGSEITDPPRTAEASLAAVIDKSRERYANQDMNGALAALEQADQAAKTENDRARVASFRAVVVARQGELEPAKTMAAGALATLKSGGAPAFAVAQAENAAGSVALMTSDFEGALVHWTSALKLDAADDPQSSLRRGRVKFNMATALASLGRPGEAIRVAKEGLEEETSGGAAACPHLAGTRMQLASFHKRQGDLREAERVLREALKSCEGVEDSRIVWAQAQLGLADVLGARKATAEALKRVGQARVVLEALPELRSYVVMARAIEAGILSEAGRDEEAVEVLTTVRKEPVGRLPWDGEQSMSMCLQLGLLLKKLERREALENLVRECKTSAAEGGDADGLQDLMDGLLRP